MGLNEEVERLIQDALQCKVEQYCQKYLKSRSTSSLDRASSRLGRAVRQNAPECCCYSLDRASSLIRSSGFSGVPKMLFSTFQVLGEVSCHSLFNINSVFSELMTFMYLVLYIGSSQSSNGHPQNTPQAKH